MYRVSVFMYRLSMSSVCSIQLLELLLHHQRRNNHTKAFDALESKMQPHQSLFLPRALVRFQDCPRFFIFPSIGSICSRRWPRRSSHEAARRGIEALSRTHGMLLPRSRFLLFCSDLQDMLLHGSFVCRCRGFRLTRPCMPSHDARSPLPP